jgi:hypothetical protein
MRLRRTVVMLASLAWCLGSSVRAVTLARTTLRGSLGQELGKGETIPIGGRRVTITDGTSTLAEAYSGYDGKYYVPKLPAGDYLLEVWFSSKNPSSFVIHARSEPYTDIALITPDNEKLNSALAKDIQDILQPFNRRVDPHGRGSSPLLKETYARRSALVPKSEAFVALIDETLTGTANDCIVFTRRGIYYHTAVLLDRYAPRRGSIRYQDFPGRDFKVLKAREISLGEHEAFSTAAGDVRQEDLINILRAIQEKVKDKIREMNF